MGKCTVVKVLLPMPTGVEAREIVKTPGSATYWATESASPSAPFDAKKDLGGPQPVMAVATKDKGKKAVDGSSDEQRVAVLGAEMLGSNSFLEMLEVQTTKSGQRYLQESFPGNSELMKNTVLWLSGYENMIAVSARSNRPASIGAVTPGKWQIVASVVGLAAVLPLIAGLIVWSRRHR